MGQLAANGGETHVGNTQTSQGNPSLISKLPLLAVPLSWFRCYQLDGLIVQGPCRTVSLCNTWQRAILPEMGPFGGRWWHVRQIAAVYGAAVMVVPCCSRVMRFKDALAAKAVATLLQVRAGVRPRKRGQAASNVLSTHAANCLPALADHLPLFWPPD